MTQNRQSLGRDTMNHNVHPLRRRLRNRAGSLKYLVGVAIFVAGSLIIAVASRRENSRDRLADVSAGPKSTLVKESKTAGDVANFSKSLTEVQRKHVWDTEHFAFIIERKVFPMIAAALRERNLPDLAHWFHAELQGRLLAESDKRQITLPFAEIEFKSAPTVPSIAVDRQSFIDSLLEFRDKLENVQGVSFALMKLVPAEEGGDADRPWHAQAKVRMWGTTPRRGPAEITLICRFDFDRVFEEVEKYRGAIRRCELVTALTTHGERFLFADMTDETGINTAALHDNWTSDFEQRKLVTGGVYLADYNLDGRLDILITDLRRHWLYRGDLDGKFVNCTEEVGLPGRSLGGWSACWADLDNDRWCDLILGDRVYQNIEGKYFADRTEESSLEFSSLTQNVTVADYDRDGWLDLFFVAAAPVPAVSLIQSSSSGQFSYIDDQTGPGNRLWRNQGNWQFLDVTAQTKTRGGGGSSFAAAWLDANDDGWPDVAVSNELGPNWLLVGDATGVFRTIVLDGDSPRFSMGVSAGDYDDDGRTDLYFAAMYSKAGQRIIANVPRGVFAPDVYQRMLGFVAGNALYRNTGSTTFDELGASLRVADAGWAYGSGFADLDNDGRLDIYALAGFQSVDRTEPDG